MPIQIVDFDPVGTKPGHDAGPGRVAKRELIVGSIKSHSAGSKPVEVRGLGNHITITP